VITLRCTQVVRKRLRLAAVLPVPGPPTTALGDWIVHLLRLGQKQVIIATSERSLLTVLLPSRELRQTLSWNLRLAVRDLLIALEIPLDAVQREIAAMEPVAFGIAENRRVLGSVNEFAYQLDAYVGGSTDPLELALRLSETPMSEVASTARYGLPRDIARELLAASHSGPISHH
jgi:hypothetical protein